MGCLRGLGCLVLVLVIAAAAWWFRADWLPLLHKGTASSAVADSASRSEPARSTLRTNASCRMSSASSREPTRRSRKLRNLA